MNILSQPQISVIQKRLPPFELSYETIAHKKVFDSYDICIAIPGGKKSFAWFSFYNDKNVCYIMEINRDKRITHMYVVEADFDAALSLGTILYGTIVNIEGEVESQTKTPFFVVEDIYYYKGVLLKQNTFGEKLGYLEVLFQKQLLRNNEQLKFFLPFLWGRDAKTTENDILNELEKHRSIIPYAVHHLQLRKLNELSPYLNIGLNNILSKICNRNEKTERKMQSIKALTEPKDFNKPQYKYPTTFLVTADIQYDIYHLFALGRNKEQIYYDTAYIQNIEKSKFMNSLFRKIRENNNLDYIEESDDEDDFEDISADKYVDLNKNTQI